MQRTATAMEHGITSESGRARGARSAGIRRRRTLTLTGFLSAVVLAVTLVSPAGSAQAINYPTWQDLQNAKANTGAAASRVTEIKGLINGLQTQVARTQAESAARGAELQLAQEKFDDAARRAGNLQAQADESKVKADAATRQAGQLAAQLYRTGGTDLSVNLFMDGESTDEGAEELLSKLGSMSKLVERSTDIYEEAQTAKNTAQSLGDQAKVAQAERETLRVAAEAALVAAQAAANAAAAALAESEKKSLELEQQLKFMQDKQATTTAGYEAGVAERKRLAAIEAARVAAARKEAARKEAARAAAAQSAAAARSAAARSTASSSAPASGGGGSSSGGSSGGQGWSVPASGRVTAGYGERQVLCGGGMCSGGFHYAADLGTGCYAGIYAAHAGRVVYAGNYGTYGNYVKIDHGGGISTGYAHLRDGGIYVSNGQSVGAGQSIGSSGDTGASTACHLHFEVWSGGSRIDPEPFMSNRGATLGW